MVNDVKQIIVVRKDLKKMGRGKAIAQGGHAAMKWLTKRLYQRGSSSFFEISLTPAEEAWVKGRFKKVCVAVENEQELLCLQAKAVEAGVMCELVTDSGRTVFDGVSTNTCLAIGPDYAENIDPITGHLRPY